MKKLALESLHQLMADQLLNDIRAGDLIVEIDKAPVGKMNIRLAIDKLRGKKGTKIELTILRRV